MNGGLMEATVLLRLADDLSGPARQASAAARKLTADLEKLKALAAGARSNGFAKEFSGIVKQAKAATTAVSALRLDLGRSARSGFSRADLGIDRVARDAREAASAVRSLRREMNEGATFRGRGLDTVDRAVGRRRGRHSTGGGEDVSGARAAAGIVGVAAAHEATNFGRESLETYREFDKERRFSGAVMGISFADQQELVRQAISMGGRTKYNDISVLEGQRELAARGLGKNSIIGMMPSAANLGMSLDMDLPDAVKLMDQAVFGFKKNINTVADATKSATQTADAIVKSAKISGMTPEDIAATYRFGATPAKMSGVSENTLLSFGGVLKRANISGDMNGTAFRAFIAAAQAPTRGAKEALLANGLDYSKYQPQVGSIPVEPFVKNVAAQYGISLNKQATGALTKVFSSPALVNDQSKFAPAVVGALSSTLGKKDLKSMKSIAGMANRFRNSIGGGADVNAFLSDLLLRLPGNLKLANALFGAKQGARIATALGDPDVFKSLKAQLDNHAAGYAQQISDARMAGFDGAVSRFEGATKNLETAIGRAVDSDGKGGPLTAITGAAAAAMQKFAEAPPVAQKVAVGAGAAVTGVVAWKSISTLFGGFGLRASAVALNEAAAALTAAAGVQRAAGAAGGAAQGIGAGIGSTAKGVLSGLGKGLIARALPGPLGLAYLLVTTPIPEITGGPSQEFLKKKAAAQKNSGGWWKNVVPDMSGIGTWLGESIVTPAHGEPAPRSPFGGLGGAKASFSSAPDIDATPARAKMAALMSNLAATASAGVSIRVDADTSAAEARVAGLKAQIASLGGRSGRGGPQFSGRLNDLGQ